MNGTLVIHDNTGFVISQMQGSGLREPVGIPFMWIDVPQGKSIVKIDTTVTPHVPVFEDIPKTDIQVLQETVDALVLASL